MTKRQKITILQIEKVLFAMVSSLRLMVNKKNDRSPFGDWGGHFLLLWISLKIAHAI